MSKYINDVSFIAAKYYDKKRKEWEKTPNFQEKINGIWQKGYTYHKLPIYKIDFILFGFPIHIWKTGYKRVRVGTKLTTDKQWEMYTKLLVGDKHDNK